MDSPPHSVEAEERIVGTLLSKPWLIGYTEQQLDEIDFYVDQMQSIYRGLIQLKGHPDLDADTIFGLLRELGKNDAGIHSAIEDRLRLVGCMEFAFEGEIGIDYYAKMIRRYASMRRAMNEAIGTLWDVANIDNDPEAVGRLSLASDGPISDLVLLENVQCESVQWLWPGKIPMGKLTLFSGDPGLGKSYVTMDIAARISVGCPFPDCQDTSNAKGSVLIYNAEDDIADTIKPRLMAAGADCENIHAFDMLGTSKGIFYLDKQLYKMARAIDSVDNCKLVIIDPISSFVSSDIDSHKSTEVRIVLSELSALAHDKNVAILVVAHLNKNTQGSAVHRTAGSMAYVAAARSVWGITKDPEDRTRRLFLPIKCNLAADTHGIAYCLRSSSSVAVVSWEAEPVDGSIDDFMKGRSSAEDDSALESAKAFLEIVLGSGPMLADDVLSQSRKEGHSEKTIRRAKEALEVVSDRLGNRWTWQLPKPKQSMSDH